MKHSMDAFMGALRIKIEVVTKKEREGLEELYRLYEWLAGQRCCDLLKGHCNRKHTLSKCPHYYDVVFFTAYRRGGQIYHRVEQVYEFLQH